MPRYLLILVFLYLSLSIHAQLNVKVAYNLAYFFESSNNDILNEFNMKKAQELNGGLSKAFSDLHLMNGISLGIRHRISSLHCLEVGWENLSSTKEAKGETNSGSLFQQKLFYSANQYYLDYQTTFSSMGFGLGLGRANVKIRDEIGNSDVKKEILTQGQWVVRTNLAYYFSGSKNVSFCIQPYLNISLDDVALDKLSQELSLDEVSGMSSAFSNFGLRFIFYNGIQ